MTQLLADDHSFDTDPATPSSNTCRIVGAQLSACLKPTFTPFLARDNSLVSKDGLVLNGVTLPIPHPTDADFIASLNGTAHGPMIDEPHDGKIPVALKPADQQVLNEYLFGISSAPAQPTKIASHYGVRKFGGADDMLATAASQNDGPRFPTPTSRTSYQTAMAEFCGYDGVALLCAPPRLYNMIATSLLLDHVSERGTINSVVAAARYLALVNLALVDAGIEAWIGKYKFMVARPVTYLRATDHARWTPMGQTASNGLPYNATPPFPAYPSGHAVFGGAAFTTMALALGLDESKTSIKANCSAFDFISDEFNGRTVDGSGNLRPYMRVHFASLAGAEWENAESRIWLGIHWQRDADDVSRLGDAIGTNIATTRLTKCKPAPVICR